MKRIVFLVAGVLPLAGCMTPQQWAYVKQPPAAAAKRSAADAGPYKLIQDNMDAANASIRAAAERSRSDFLKAHPDDPYSDAIAKGYLQRGMTLEEIDAAGYFCEMKEQSEIGSVYRCKSLAVEASDLPDDEAYAKYVGLNNDGKVESIQH